MGAVLREDMGLESHEPDLSFWELASVLVRRRKLIVLLGVIGALAFGLLAITRGRVYQASATFIAQDAPPETGSGLELAASQLGLDVSRAGKGWSTAMYVKLLDSWALLEPIALDTVTIAEEGGRRARVIDLLGVTAPDPRQRVEKAVAALRQHIVASDDRRLGTVSLSVTTKWPSVSFALAQSLVQGLNRFNIETRRSQATAEREFVERQADQAKTDLRSAEDNLQNFLQQNRDPSSPQLAFERDRLQREVLLRQSVYNGLMQSEEQAKIREVRNTPVITLIDTPRLPVIGQPHHTVKRTILGGFIGAMLGVVIALLGYIVARSRESRNDSSKLFFEALADATPQFIAARRN